MPELPEVQTVCDGIRPHIQGQILQDIAIYNPNLRWPVPETLIRQQLLSQSSSQPALLNRVTRRGKYILLDFVQGGLIIHLGMTGSLRIVSTDEPPSYHDHVDLIFNKVCVRYRDPRRFGCLLWHSHPIENHALLCGLGPEPLQDEFNTRLLIDLCKGRKQAIKTLIMDSKKVVGVGNIYANEALYMAGIHPARQAGRISAKRLEKLCVAIKQVLSHAIEQGGTTLKDFVNSEGNPGYFKQQLFVYGRKGKPCKSCTKALVEIRLGQRSTVYCPQCQR